MIYHVVIASDFSEKWVPLFGPMQCEAAERPSDQIAVFAAKPNRYGSG